MDLVAEMLLAHLEAAHAGSVRALRIRPRLLPRFSRWPLLGRWRGAGRTDIILSRFRDYPRRLRRSLPAVHYFHICDHSYAHLVHVLPRERTGVYCHDLDVFRCLLEPGPARRPRWFRKLALVTLQGLEKAALVFYSTANIREQIIAHGIADPNAAVRHSLAGLLLARRYETHRSLAGQRRGMLRYGL